MSQRQNSRSCGQGLKEGWHFSCECSCTQDDHGKAGPFSVERLKMDLSFVQLLCVYKSSVTKHEVPALLGLSAFQLKHRS